jgi:hypothetical protein
MRWEDEVRRRGEKTRSKDVVKSEDGMSENQSDEYLTGGFLYYHAFILSTTTKLLNVHFSILI